MEDVKKLLEQNGAYLTNSSDGDDSGSEGLSDLPSRNWYEGGSYSNNETFETECAVEKTIKKRNGEKRLPTRRPDPNVYNRNALLARENRRKKKMYLETIEKELRLVRQANRTLAKTLKRQLKLTQRLAKEKQYYENLVKNRFDMLSPVDVLNCRHIPDTEEYLLSTTNNKEDDVFRDVIGRCGADADALAMEFDIPSDDLYESTESSVSSSSATWDDTWRDKGYNIDNLISTNLTILQNSAHIKNFNDDHCYAAASTISNITTDHKGKSNDYIDVEGDWSCCGKLSESFFIPCPTPPLELLSRNSS